MVTRSLSELAAELNGEVVGDPTVVIGGVAGIREAMPGDITFLANSRYDAHLRETAASAVICSREARDTAIPLIIVDNPYLAFQRAVRIFRPDRHRPAPGVHATAVVSPEASLGDQVSIGPYCVIEAGARIGDRTVLMTGCVIGHGSVIGDDTFLYPQVIVREDCVLGSRCILHPGIIVGSDGFGFAFDAGRFHKVPQVGNVVVGDDVEIGANTTIDRATTHSTRIGDGTKIDNLVQIGHNVVIGRHCIIVAQVGISGSTELEDHVTLGGQAGLVGHIRIGKGAMVGAQSGVTKSVPAETVVTGYPATQHILWRKLQALFHRLPDLSQRTRDLEERVAGLERERERAREGVR
ncbi:MAG: UDP-3-O-(3-hydroxymyristoyl)glucosamine N-acyltransferase [Candidatus Eisenbacteria bacterium]|uniref:UDP-3-O-acylglucosamine N-acyltransferase n=1 Tax=Eiseniibacteriota bacterium TaxID=2212470 RepID=A0A9D6L7D2_UNCEI|nr:UDP-3-O-(3-hydroxymyristoyl)glucosamine N-acyltransferase [Candidatus Eisenbacteria bacterium]MBI3540116.1 UDP-3-O-(3-hydroxymyristoyl)glucosamine N-acyltransferase [Candidatus Eisenbacteria bacterium]